MSTRLVLVCALSVASFTQPALAADSGWYVGASFGTVSSDVRTAALAEVHDSALFIDGLFAAPAGDARADDTSTTWSVLAGYHISPNVSVEAAYADLGEITYDYRGEFGFRNSIGAPPAPSVTLFPGTSSIKWDNSVVSVKVIGRLPFKERFDVHAQVGGAMVRTDVESSTRFNATSPESYVVEDDADTLGLVYGAGAAVRVGSSWGLSLDWQRYEVSEDEDTPLDLDASYDALTLALTYAFGRSK